MIYIIIPNYNGFEHLKVCFDSLYKQTYKDFEIIFVDNGSDDNSVNFIQKEYPGVEIIKNKTNLGFAKSVNIGINYAIKEKNANCILLLNNDIECKDNFLEEMSKGFVTKEIGSVACKMLNYFDRSILDDAGDFVKVNGSPFARGNGEKDIGQYDKEEFIIGACAGAALYKREVFEKVGLFDEDFISYYEDVDFALRMQLMGYKCYYNPKAICYHKRGATTKNNTGYQTMLCEKNLMALRIKNYPLITLLKYEFLFIAVRIQRYWRFLHHHSFKLFSQAIKGYFLGILQIPKLFVKRMHIQRTKTINRKYFEDMLE